LTSELKLEKAQKQEDIKEIYNFNVKAFADSQDFAWTQDNISKEIKAGWELYSAKVGEEIVCAIFLKKENDVLMTKNTPIKINHQGNGFSHLIKDFYEDLAKKEGIFVVKNYCPEDNFRMVALNERHDYTKTGKILADKNTLIEWEKKLK